MSHMLATESDVKHDTSHVELATLPSAEPGAGGKGYAGGERLGARPSNDPSLHHDHPINFSPVRKVLILVTLSYAGFLANYSAAGIQVAFPNAAASFGVTVPAIANTVGYNILGLGCGPLIWNPLSRTVGRRPVYLVGSALFIATVAWMAAAKSYESFVVARVLAGVVSSFSQTVPPSSIADIYPREVRGDKIAWFGTCVVVAPAIAPIICGLVINGGLTWRVCYWIVLGMAVLQMAMFALLVPETLWVERGAEGERVEAEPERAVYEPGVEQGVMVRAGRRGPAWMPWANPSLFGRYLLSPILMARYAVITLTSIYYGSIFAYSVGITIVIPELYVAPPHAFKTLDVGLCFIAFGVGSVLGKWSGGVIGDRTVGYVAARPSNTGKGRRPEYRLWALLPILPVMFVGLLVTGIGIQRDLGWSVPLVGGGVYFFCLVASTGILQTYVLESYLPRSMDTQLVFNFFKCLFGFVAPYFAMPWGEAAGFTEAYAIQGALATGVGALLVGGLLVGGHGLRRAQGMPM